jgi:hypothetical protein
MLRTFIDLLWKIIPNMKAECPQKVPYHFEVLNITISKEVEEGTKFSDHIFAKGTYRNILKFHDDVDLEGFRVEWRAEVRSR